MTTNYRRGRDLEYSVVTYLTKLGYCAQRSAGSHKPVDVIAGNGIRMLAIQCKNRKRPEISTREWEALLKWARAYRACPILVERRDRKTTWSLLTPNYGYMFVDMDWLLSKCPKCEEELRN